MVLQAMPADFPGELGLQADADSIVGGSGGKGGKEVLIALKLKLNGVAGNAS